MNNPCNNCIILSVCISKKLLKRIQECEILNNFILDEVVEIKESNVIIPQWIVVFETIFLVTHYTLYNSHPFLKNQLMDFDGIGLTRRRDDGISEHLTIGKIPSSKKIIYKWPVKILKPPIQERRI